MSFILDALKKLEQKHRQGSVPDLMTVHAPEPPKPAKRAMWPYLIIAALLINAGIMIAWLYTWKAEEQKAVAQAKAPVKQQDNTADSEQKNTAASASLSAKSSNETVKTTTIAPDKEPVSEPDMAVARTNSDSTGNALQDSLSQTETGKDSDVKTDESVQSPADSKLASFNLDLSAQELEVLRNKIKEEQSSAGNYVPINTETTEITEPQLEDNVPELSQLPPEIRKELPDLSVSGHIYSNNPESRIVNINGHIIREGENVSEGLKLEEITMSGVIFNYRGLRFKLRTF